MDVPSGATRESMAEHHKGLDVVREVASEGARPWKMYSGHGIVGKKEIPFLFCFHNELESMLGLQSAISGS